VHDVVEGNSFRHGVESLAFGEAGYQGIEKRPGKRNALNMNNEVDARIDKAEELNARVRAQVEHPFRVTKRQFGFVNVRYRGLKENTAQLLTLFALSNLWMVRGKLMNAP
jgi:transposase, IS5 family